MFALEQFVIEVDPLKHATLGLAGLPVVVTVPAPAGVVYPPVALRKEVADPPVVKVTPLTTCPAGSTTVPVNVGEAKGAYPGIVSPLGSVVLSEGTPPELVTNTALFAGAIYPVVAEPVCLGIELVVVPERLVAVVAVVAEVALVAVVAVAAFPPMLQDAQVPEALVITKAVGVPSAGVVRVRLVALSPEGSVVLSEGTPEPLVPRTALFTGVTNPVVFAAD